MTFVVDSRPFIQFQLNLILSSIHQDLHDTIGLKRYDIRTLCLVYFFVAHKYNCLFILIYSTMIKWETRMALSDFYRFAHPILLMLVISMLWYRVLYARAGLGISHFSYRHELWRVANRSQLLLDTRFFKIHRKFIIFV